MNPPINNNIRTRGALTLRQTVYLARNLLHNQRQLSFLTRPRGMGVCALLPWNAASLAKAGKQTILPQP
jgi:hypothetical protein